MSIPVTFEVIRKPICFCDIATRQEKRASKVSKNELLRKMIDTCIKNDLKFRYILMDCLYSAKENFEHIVERNKHLISALKSNRLFASSLENKQQGRFVAISELELSDRQVVRGWLKGFYQEVLLVCRIFTNKDGSTQAALVYCIWYAATYPATANKSPRFTKNGGK